MPFSIATSKHIDPHTKQYEAGGLPVGPSYQRQTKEEKADKKPQLIASTDRAWFYTARNALSPFLKRISNPAHIRSSEQNAFGNRLAAFVHKHPDKSKYFSINFYVGKKNGHDTYLTRRIHGFTLDDDIRMTQAVLSGELSEEKIQEKMADLADAVEWLNSNGYYHNDISLSNIMYDTQARDRVFVLIDFECADNGQRYGGHGEKKFITILGNDLLGGTRDS